MPATHFCIFCVHFWNNPSLCWCSPPDSFCCFQPTVSMKHWTSCPSLGKYASKNECPDKLSAVMLDLGIKPWFLDVKAQATQYLTILHMYSISLNSSNTVPWLPSLHNIWNIQKPREGCVSGLRQSWDDSGFLYDFRCTSLLWNVCLSARLKHRWNITGKPEVLHHVMWYLILLNIAFPTIVAASHNMGFYLNFCSNKYLPRT